MSKFDDSNKGFKTKWASVLGWKGICDWSNTAKIFVVSASSSRYRRLTVSERNDLSATSASVLAFKCYSVVRSLCDHSDLINFSGFTECAIWCNWVFFLVAVSTIFGIQILNLSHWRVWKDLVCYIQILFGIIGFAIGKVF